MKHQFFRKDTYGGGDLHLWVGPLGFHLFWPDFLHSRIDWCWNWQEEELEEPSLAELADTSYRAERIVARSKHRNLAPVFLVTGLAGAILPLIQAVMASSTGTFT